MNSDLELIKRLMQIGVALSAEKNIDRLLEMIVEEAMSFTRADGGTLYIMSDDETALHFAIVRNKTLQTHMGGTGDKITWPSVMLKNATGCPNFANVSAYAAICGETVNIPDVYNAQGFDFQGTRKFDSETGYRSQSMLVVPLMNHENDIIGVLQLLNALDPETGKVIDFSKECQQISASLASQAAVALSNNRLIQDLEQLLESFIATIATAIDEKSPYTGGHIQRVATLTMTIAEKINATHDGPYGLIEFDQNMLKELRIAAWLHDIGKITTPEYVVDKATKLSTIFDRIENVKLRLELAKRDHEIAALKKQLLPAAAATGCGAPENAVSTPEPAGQRDIFCEELEDDLLFLMNANRGGEFMADTMIERIKTIAQRTWIYQGKPEPLLTDDEIDNLTIRRGTLTEAEREIINNHVLITHRMLSQLPFPKKLKHIPLFAAAHHEKIDGTGYPFGLKEDSLTLQARILALADVFEALTAKDRPYKKGKKLSEAMSILSFMVKDGHIDRELFELFRKEKIYLDYARKELLTQQIDIVDFS